MSLFSNMTIQRKLLALNILNTVVIAAVLALAMWLMTTYSVFGPVDQQVRKLQELKAIVEPAKLAVTRPYQVIIKLAAAQDAGEIETLTRQFQDFESNYRKDLAEYTTGLPEDSLKRKLTVDAHTPADEIFRIAREQILPLVRSQKGVEAKAVFDSQIAPLYETHIAAIYEAVELIDMQLTEQERIASDAIRRWLRTMTVISIAAVIVLWVSSYLLAKSIGRSTRKLIGRVEELAGGASDLTARLAIDSHDELGQLAEGVNSMIAKIQLVVQRVRETSVALLSTASEMAATANRQDSTMQGLGSSSAQIAAAVREISATGKQLSGTMNEVSSRADQAATLASSGRSRLADMETNMNGLMAATDSISSKLAVIREKAENINSVVTTITKVADQTNLLSINAAIEAEKAGEYGRGFLVVAREIRRLADQTAVATLDIETIVRHMQDAVSAGVMQMDKFSGEVRSGVQRVAEISGQTGQIIEEVQILSDRFQQVSEGMRNQAIGAEQINEAMGQVTAGAQQTQTAMKEFNEATGHLRQSVEVLNHEVGQFTV